MGLFNRKQNNSVLPEVDKYYEGERKDRAGLAWLLALVSVAVAALVIIGVFLGGRWIVQQITNDDEEVAVVENNEDGQAPSFDGGTVDENGQITGNDSPDSGSEDEGSQDDADSDEQPAAGTDTETVPERTPATGGSESLPSTGPEHMVAVFAVISTAAGLAHNLFSRKKA